MVISYIFQSVKISKNIKIFRMKEICVVGEVSKRAMTPAPALARRLSNHSSFATLAARVINAEQ
jgi:hypothetical protein